MLAVHLRFNDASTKLPTPVRLSIVGPNGESFAPFGRLAHFACGVGEDVGGHLRTSGENFTYINGTCEIRLPAGVPLRIRATKGIEYAPLDREVVLGAGQLALRLEIERLPDFLGDGWMSGDVRAHFLSPQAACLEAAAEGLNHVDLLAKVFHRLASDGNTYGSMPGILELSGQTYALPASPGPSVVVNTFNSHPVLGSLALLNCHRPVYPLAFGEPYGSDDWSLLDWCNQCHRKNGLVVWSQAFLSEGGEALLAAVLGKLDAIEMTAGQRTPPLLPWYYRLLNAGLALPIVGASGKDSNRKALGSMRTYAYIGNTPERTYQQWIEAIRSGQTFVTNGPLLSWSCDSRIRVSAVSLSKYDKLDVVMNGVVAASTKPERVAERYHAELDVQPPENGWVAVRCVGGPAPLDPSTTQFAHSSPRWFGTIQREPASVNALVEQIEHVREWAELRGQYTDSKWKNQLLANCLQAIDVLRSPRT